MNFDIAARRVGVRTDLVSSVYQQFRDRTVYSRQVHLEAGCEAVDAVNDAQIHFDIDGDFLRKRVPLASDDFDRRKEACGPAGRE